jgi:hypothetical protein
MKYALAVVGIVLTCSCGKVAGKTVDASGLDAETDATTVDAMVDACPARAETLDLQDNDCDGQIDNGFWATVFTTPQTTLAARDAGCGDATAITGDAYACQLAARRECQARGYAAGFRPAEADATNVAFTCTADVHMMSAISYAELVTYIPSCAAATAFQTPCFAAIKRYCQNKGFKTGIGPLNVDTDASIDLLCTDHADYVGITISQLQTVSPGCRIPTSNPWDFACFHGYHRYCRSLGWDSGWGPVEYDGTTVYMACLNTRPRS